MKHIGIIGSRTRNSTADFQATLMAFQTIYTDGDWIVSGGCPTGGDMFAKQLHKRFTTIYLEFPARWNKHGKIAGFIRKNEK